VSIEPNSMFDLSWSVTALVMVIVGGMGTLWGPVIGAYVIYYGVDRSLGSPPRAAVRRADHRGHRWCSQVGS
jgi:branched-chain amino acid transport system permease protein